MTNTVTNPHPVADLTPITSRPKPNVNQLWIVRHLNITVEYIRMSIPLLEELETENEKLRCQNYDLRQKLSQLSDSIMSPDSTSSVESPKTGS